MKQEYLYHPGVLRHISPWSIPRGDIWRKKDLSYPIKRKAAFSAACSEPGGTRGGK